MYGQNPAYFQSECNSPASEEIVNPYHYHHWGRGKFYPHWPKLTNAKGYKKTSNEKEKNCLVWVSKSEKKNNGHRWKSKSQKPLMHISKHLIPYWNWNCWNFLAALPNFFFLLHMVNYLAKSIFGRCSAVSSRLSLTKSSALAEWGIKCLAVAVKCSAGPWTKRSTHRFPFLTVGIELRVPVHLCTTLSGKLMAGCSPKWEMVVGTHCEMASFPSIAKLHTRQYEKKAGKILKRIS